MPAVGAPPTCSPGLTRNHVLWRRIDHAGQHAVRVRAILRPEYTEKYYSVFVNGIYIKNVWVGAKGILEEVIPTDPGTTVGSVDIQDAGQWAAFEDGFIPSTAEEAEAESAMRLQFTWQTPYRVTSIRGDTQISITSITGAQRGINVANVPSRPTRGKLHYQIINEAGTYIVRWWAGRELVAEGTRVGNGSVTCSAINNSGLSIVCTITFTAEVNPGRAFVEIAWPKSYQIHYSTSALSFPRTPEGTLNDEGIESYAFLSDELSAGAYNWNILWVDDGGNVQASGFPSTSAKTINTNPLPPTVTSIVKSGSNFVVTWTVGESGCTFTVYSSPVNYPVNLGDYTNPAAVTTALNATTANVPIPDGPGKVRFIVRATKGGRQETTDVIHEVEIDASEAIINPRPNRAEIQDITITSGLTIEVEGAIVEDEAAAAASHFDLYVKALASGAINPDSDSAQASVALDTAVLGVKRKDVSYAVGGSGWYRVALLARTSAGARSRSWIEHIIEVSNATMDAVLNPKAKVIRGKQSV